MADSRFSCRRKFCAWYVTATTASTLSLSLDIAADNDVVAALNGTTILSCTTGGAVCFSAFTSNHSINAGGIALAGVNTLTFTITNEGTTPNPTALRVQASGTATSTSTVPEPGTLVLLGVGLAGLGLLRCKRFVGGKPGVLLTSSRD